MILGGSSLMQHAQVTSNAPTCCRMTAFRMRASSVARRSQGKIGLLITGDITQTPIHVCIVIDSLETMYVCLMFML